MEHGQETSGIEERESKSHIIIYVEGAESGYPTAPDDDGTRTRTWKLWEGEIAGG